MYYLDYLPRKVQSVLYFLQISVDFLCLELIVALEKNGYVFIVHTLKIQVPIIQVD